MPFGEIEERDSSNTKPNKIDENDGENGYISIEEKVHDLKKLKKMEIIMKTALVRRAEYLKNEAVKSKTE